MSDVSEHSDSEFYYPDDLSDTKLLQQPTSFESEEKKSKLLTYEEVQNFIRNQQQASTVNKTMYDMNVFQKFPDECGEKRRITEIAPAELDSLLCNFYISAKKKENTAYEPDTMSSFSRSIQRYLEDNKLKQSSISSRTRNSRSQEKSLNPSHGNSRSRIKGTNQMPQEPSQTKILSASLMKISLAPMILMSFCVLCGSCSLFTSATEQDTRQGK